jgi:hypothetical protein
MFLSKSYCGHRRRERSLGLVACGSLPGNRMHYPVASQFMDALAQICRSRNTESHAASEQSLILMIQRSLAGSIGLRSGTNGAKLALFRSGTY